MPEKTQTQLQQEERTFAAVEKMAEAMTGGIKKWEKVLYSMMVMFIILAIYGFYLIYQLAHDVRQISTNMITMTRAVVTMTNTLNINMGKVDAQMSAINLTMDHMRRNVEGLKEDTAVIADVMPSLHNQFASMNSAMVQMNDTVQALRISADSMARSLWELDQNISEPMSSMNSVIPFGMMPKKKSKWIYNPPPVRQGNMRPYYAPQYYYPQPQAAQQRQPEPQHTQQQPETQEKAQ